MSDEQSLHVHAMKNLFLLIFIVALGWRVEAATNVAASVSYADVSAATVGLTDGDQVNIPSGSATWASTLTLTKAISLIGAGTNLTVITANATSLKLVDYTAVGADVKFRVSGITFVGLSGHTVPILKLKGKDSSGVGQEITQVRIDHCKFTFGLGSIQRIGWVYGVVDHSTFIDSDTAMYSVGDDSQSWARGFTYGTTNAFFVENCGFVADNSAPSDPNEFIYNQEGARVVVRFNIFDGTARNPGNAYFFDSHGNWAGGGGAVDPTSAAALNFRANFCEVYGNTFAVGLVNFVGYIRGGYNLWASNTVTVARGLAFPIKVDDEEYNTAALFTPLRTTYPAANCVTNSFFFANTLSGLAWAGTDIHLADASVLLQVNRDWWFQAPNATNGSPAGAYASWAPAPYPHPLVAYYDGITAPTISAIANQSIPQDTSTAALAFTVGDSVDPASSLTVTATSSNHTLADDADCVLGGSGASRTVTITPNGGQTGVTTITLVVTNLSLLTATNTFTLTVTTPSIKVGGNVKKKGRFSVR